jgi:4-hydroxy-3-methylbut-2-enyl diphosphate reductase
MGIQFIGHDEHAVDALDKTDVVILPAFGVTVGMLQRLDARGCTLIDTTCGSVLNVWKNVRRYAEGGYTSVIHGKVWHEETQATASQAVAYGGRYLVVLDRHEAARVCDLIRRPVRHADDGGRQTFVERFGGAASPGFDPDADLQRIGLANQTTMLMSESLEIGEMLKVAMLDRYGASELEAHFQAFDTICSATQDRQDAVVALLREQRVDNLARICAESRPTFHIADPDCLVSAEDLRHRPVGSKTEVRASGWLPADGPVSVGLTAGASTPDNLVGAVVAKLADFARASTPPPRS